MFYFSGDIILSKSWLNRAQIIYHLAGESFPFVSHAEDVTHLKSAIAEIGKSSEFHLGQGGTSFRFFIFLISKIPGTWKVFADKQLLKRPQGSLLSILQQLGVKCKVAENHFEIQSGGWLNSSSVVTCDAGLSSQFVSGLLLSCWQLPAGIQVKVPKPVKSKEYLNMTVSLLKQAGMKIDISESETSLSFVVEKSQMPDVSRLKPEADISSAFSLAAAAVVGGSVNIKNWPEATLQPDLAFLDAFKQMNIRYEAANGTLKIEKHDTWNGCEMNVGDSPDLFPVLSALCALGEGKSRIYGAEHLKVKESDRLAKTAELLKICGVRFEELNDGLIIYGRSLTETTRPLKYDPAGDHRMAMAASLFKLYGFNIEILDRDCVAKSYPRFWSDIGL